MVCLFATPERGKSRTGKGMIYAAHHGVHVESLNEPYIVRLAERFRVSLFFDVMDIWKKTEQKGSEDILLGRYERGARVPKVLRPENEGFEDMEYFSIFGPTVIGTNEGISGPLESRAIQINMPISTRRFENSVSPEVALPFKERLTAFRAMHLGSMLPICEKPANGRLGDILKPLYQIVLLSCPEREQIFRELIKEIEASRTIERSETLEAKVIKAVIRNERGLESGVIPVKMIVITVNIDKPDQYRYSSPRVGRILASLGFKKTRINNGQSAIHYDEKLIKQLRERYGITESVLSAA